jgi:hypothetical protein
VVKTQVDNTIVASVNNAESYILIPEVERVIKRTPTFKEAGIGNFNKE